MRSAIRLVFLALLAANVLFLAWAQWIDAPQGASAQESTSGLPKLQLSTEAKPGAPASDNAPAATEPPAPSANDAPAPLATPASTSNGSAAATASKVALAPAVTSVAPTCTSIGPFNDITSAAKAAGILAQRGFTFQQRAEEGDTIEGFWVYVGGLDTDEDVAKVIDKLSKAGFPDAHVMKNYSTNRRVSVGLFSKRERADRRAAAVKNMGLSPEVVERKFPGTVYWVDVSQGAEAGAKKRPLPADYNFAEIGTTTKIGMQPCPTPVRPAIPVQGSPDDVDGVTKGLPRTTVASAPKGPPQ